jgi:hypothetical protein
MCVLLHHPEYRQRYAVNLRRRQSNLYSSLDRAGDYWRW